MDSDIKAARACRDEACEAYLNTRKARDELVQSVHKAKAALDEALRLGDEIWDDDEVDDLVLEFSEKRLPGLEDELDRATERLSEQQAALLQMSAEYHQKKTRCNALKSTARLGTPSVKAFPKTPGDDTKAPATNSGTEEVRHPAEL